MASVSATKIPMWLDVDTGHDDAFAILLAARHPEIELLGISTTFGNAPLQQTTDNTRAILKAIGREDVPVYAGAAKPFCRRTWHAAEIHGASGLDGTTCLPVPDVDVKGDGPAEAVEAMYRALISTEKGSAWLVPTGALTNSALLFALHPDLADHLAGVSIMGGAIGGGFNDAVMGRVEGEGERFGNWTKFAEFNIYIDPEAAKSIFSNAVLARKTTLIPLDLTHKFLATVQVQEGLRYGFDSEGQREQEPISTVRKLFQEILTFFTGTYAEVFALTAGPPLHDPLAVAAVLMPEVFDDRGGERFDVEVVTDGLHGPYGMFGAEKSECGRTVARAVEAGGEGVRIPRDLDQGRVWRALEDCLGRAEKG